MINHCANSSCSKPLHYLREGRIFVFEVPDALPGAGKEGGRPHRIEHFWLCGECSHAFLLERTSDGGVQVVPRPPIRSRKPTPIRTEARAS